MSSRFSQPAEELYDKTREYAEAKVDDVKLRLVKGLSVSVSKLLGLILFLGVASAFVLVLSFGLILLLAEWMGLSYGVTAVIVAGILLVACVVLFLIRDKLFQSSFVRLFVRLFFGGQDDE